MYLLALVVLLNVLVITIIQIFTTARKVKLCYLERGHKKRMVDIQKRQLLMQDIKKDFTQNANSND